MVNYANAKIYRIVSDQTDRVYIGATTCSLSKRMVEHRCAARSYLAGAKGGISSSEIVQFDDAIIVLVEDWPCDNIEQLGMRERHWIENTPNCVNRNIPGRTDAEWRLDNRDVILEKHRAYYVAHKDIMNAQSKAYVAANKDATREYKAAHYETNKAAIREQQRAYYRANADAMKARQARAVVCECGLNTTYGSQSNHRKSKRHADRLAADRPIVAPVADATND